MKAESYYKREVWQVTGLSSKLVVVLKLVCSNLSIGEAILESDLVF